MFIAGAPELAVHPAAVVKGPQPTITPADQHALTVRPFPIYTKHCLQLAITLPSTSTP